MKLKSYIGLLCLLVAGVQAASAVDSSGRNSHFWITLKPLSATASPTKPDLVLQNGYRRVTLDSPDFSCTRKEVGGKWVYQIIWKGNDLHGSPAADALQFDIVLRPDGEACALLDVGVNGADIATKGLVLESTCSRVTPRKVDGRKARKNYYEIHASIVLRDPALKIEDPNHPFSDLRDGHTMGPIAYAPTHPEKLKAFPPFSWEKIPRGMLIRKSAPYTDADIKVIAENYDLVVLEKANGAGKGSCSLGMKDTGARLKKINPDIKVLFYWNSRIFFGHYGIDDEISRRRDEWIHPTFVIRGRLPTYVRENPDFLRWWVGCAKKMISHPAIDGTFVDKAGVPLYMLDALYRATPVNKLVMNNNSSARVRIGYVDGTYREGWSGAGNPETIATTIAIAQETGANRKMQILRNPIKSANSPREFEDRVDRVLAIYLLYAEKYSYFYYQNTVDAREPRWRWAVTNLDQFNRPLGKPLGPAIRDNWVYTRSFEHCDVYLNLRRAPGAYNTRVLWKNDIGNPGVPGSGMSSADNTYTIRGSGGFAGTSDRFFYLSDAHYGDGMLRASIDSVENTHEHAKAGIMFRESLAADARMVALLRDPAGRLHMYYRAEQGAKLRSARVVNAAQYRYVALVRKGDTFAGACSPDGKKWTKLSQVSIPMREKIEMGMAVASHRMTTLAEATFSALARNETSKTATGDEIDEDDVAEDEEGAEE